MFFHTTKVNRKLPLLHYYYSLQLSGAFPAAAKTILFCEEKCFQICTLTWNHKQKAKLSWLSCCRIIQDCRLRIIVSLLFLFSYFEFQHKLNQAGCVAVCGFRLLSLLYLAILTCLDNTCTLDLLHGFLLSRSLHILFVRLLRLLNNSAYFCFQQQKLILIHRTERKGKICPASQF